MRGDTKKRPYFVRQTSLVMVCYSHLLTGRMARQHGRKVVLQCYFRRWLDFAPRLALRAAERQRRQRLVLEAKRDSAYHNLAGVVVRGCVLGSGGCVLCGTSCRSDLLCASCIRRRRCRFPPQLFSFRALQRPSEIGWLNYIMAHLPPQRRDLVRCLLAAS